MNKIAQIQKERQDIIKSYSGKKLIDTPMEADVKKHPLMMNVVIKDIISEANDTKSFILKPDYEKGSNSFPTFYPGQYISVQLKIDGVLTNRAYSLSSSPKEALKGIYRITVKKVENGLVSNYMLNNLKVGDKLTISRPMGEFYYHAARDEENVIAVAGGSGITPFLSLAKSIIEGTCDCNLTVLYSVRREKDIIAFNEIKEMNKSKKVKFVITLTREEKEGYKHGHITKDMLKPYLQEFNTIFMCGPKDLYKSMNEILSELDIPRKSVHFENYNLTYTPDQNNTYELKVILKNDLILSKCRSNETLLVALEKAHIKAPAFCRVGTCGFCKCKLIDGKIKMIGGNLKKAELENDYIHTCITYPESDIVLKLDI